MLYPRGDAVQPKAIMACKFPVRARAPLAMLLWQNVVAKIDGPFVHTDLQTLPHAAPAPYHELG